MYHIGMHQIASETPIHKRGRGTLSKIMPNVGEVCDICWAWLGLGSVFYAFGTFPALSSRIVFDRRA